jgi:hypothetical protein
MDRVFAEIIEKLEELSRLADKEEEDSEHSKMHPVANVMVKWNRTLS